MAVRGTCTGREQPARTPSRPTPRGGGRSLVVTGVLPAAAGGTVSAFLRFPGLSRIAAVTRITGVMKRHESFFWRGQRAGRTESPACREGWFSLEQTGRGRGAQSRPLPPAQSAPGRALALALGASVLFRRKVTRSGRNPRPQGRTPGSRGQLWAPQPAPCSPMARSAEASGSALGPLPYFLLISVTGPRGMPAWSPTSCSRSHSSVPGTLGWVWEDWA